MPLTPKLKEILTDYFVDDPRDVLRHLESVSRRESVKARELDDREEETAWMNLAQRMADAIAGLRSMYITKAVAGGLKAEGSDLKVIDEIMKLTEQDADEEDPPIDPQEALDDIKDDLQDAADDDEGWNYTVSSVAEADPSVGIRHAYIEEVLDVSTEFKFEADKSLTPADFLKALDRWESKKQPIKISHEASYKHGRMELTATISITLTSKNTKIKQLEPGVFKFFAFEDSADIE